MSGERRRMRVGFLSERADFYGGGQRSLRDLVFALAGSSVEPIVLLPGSGELASALEAQGTSCLRLGLPPLRRAAGASACIALTRLVGLVRRHRLDLLHSDSPRTALYAGVAARLTGRRHVWHLRASRPSSGLTDRVLLGLCDAALAVSKAVALRSPASRSSSKIRIVPTGMREIAFLGTAAARIELDLPPGRFIAGVVGRVEPDKGADDAIAALPALRRAAPGALLAFLGPVDQDRPWGHAGRQDTAAAGIAEAVLFLGARPEAARLLPAFDVILHPSRHEALPRVLIEALFAGVPIVAAAVGGVTEMIEPGVSGLLVPSGDPIALGDAASLLARDPALRSAMARAGRARARALFGIGPMRNSILAVYRELLPESERTTLARHEARP